MSQVQLILGTMMCGARADTAESRRMLDRFTGAGWKAIDTAYVYSAGASEKIIGEWLTEAKIEGLSIATKAHPRVTGALDAATVKKELETSLQRLQVQSVDLFYLHEPDLHHSVEGALEMCAQLYEEGRFNRLGLSNFPAWLVEKVYYVCDAHGWPKPQVYQGMYNAITRAAEPELFPALRDLGIKFYAYNPLAGGLLTGRYSSFENKPESGRFAAMPFYLDRFWKESAFKALDQVARECREHNLPMAETALRWMLHHSQLSAMVGDGVIIGASTVDQLSANLKSAQGGPLPEPIVKAYETAWETAKCECPSYFRFYSQ